MRCFVSTDRFQGLNIINSCASDSLIQKRRVYATTNYNIDMVVSAHSTACRRAALCERTRSRQEPEWKICESVFNHNGDGSEFSMPGSTVWCKYLLCVSLSMLVIEVLERNFSAVVECSQFFIFDHNFSSFLDLF